MAGQLCGVRGTHDVIDASVVLCALARRHRIVTSDPKDLARIRVDEVMEPAFPQVDSKAPVELAAGLLRHYDAVLVTAKGEVTGIVTKSDLMKLL